MMAKVSSQRIADLRRLTEKFNLHVPPSYFVSSVSREPYEDALDPILGLRGDDPVNLYIGIPLCEEHCSFCMYFHGLADADGARAEECLRGLEGFLRRIAGRGQRPVVSGSYIGGGTPTVLSASQISRLLGAVRSAFAFEPSAQRTFEMSPGSATPQKIEAIARGGYNRVSFGVQSFDRAMVERVGRTWASPPEVRELIGQCRGAGLDEINVDLMTGLDGEQNRTLADAVEALVDEAELTISVYRYRPGRSRELAARHGMNDYVSRCAERVAAAADIARRHGWRTSGRLDGEHVRLTPDRAMRWPERNLYETRYRPDLRNSLIGVGVAARSFLRNEQMVHCAHRASAGYELAGRLVEVERCDQASRVSAALVNEFFRDRQADAALVEAQCGLAPEDVFADELAYLIGEGVLCGTGRVYEIEPSRHAEWAYLDKLLYPPDWLRHRGETARLR